MYFVWATPNIQLAMRQTRNKKGGGELTTVGDQLARRVGKVDPSVR